MQLFTQLSLSPALSLSHTYTYTTCKENDIHTRTYALVTSPCRNNDLLCISTALLLTCMLCLREGKKVKSLCVCPTQTHIIDPVLTSSGLFARAELI